MVIAIPISISGAFFLCDCEQDTDANINCTHYSSIVMNGDTDLTLPVHIHLVFGPREMGVNLWEPTTIKTSKPPLGNYPVCIQLCRFNCKMRGQRVNGGNRQHKYTNITGSNLKFKFKIKLVSHFGAASRGPASKLKPGQLKDLREQRVGLYSTRCRFSWQLVCSADIRRQRERESANGWTKD